MEKRERLDYWKAIAIDALRAAGCDGDADLIASYAWKDEYDMHNYFACFPPDGAGLERVFAGIVGGEEIRLRLLRVFDAANSRVNGWGYFVVSQPLPATEDRLIELAKQHLIKMHQIAVSYCEGEFDEGDELVGLLGSMPRIEIKREPKPQRDPMVYCPESNIYGTSGDWFIALTPLQSDALMLHEALYMMTCRYDIAQYVLWPLYRNSTPLEDPFLPCFELWRHGADAYFGEPGLVTVYVPGAK